MLSPLSRSLFFTLLASAVYPAVGAEESFVATPLSPWFMGGLLAALAMLVLFTVRGVIQRAAAAPVCALAHAPLQATLDAMLDGVITLDAHLHVEFINPAAARLFGVSATAVTRLALTKLFDKTDNTHRHHLIEMVKRARREKQHLHFVTTYFLAQTKGGDTPNIEVRITPIVNARNKIGAIVMVFHDISEIKRLTNEVAYQSSHDALTELFNRYEFEKYLAKAINSAKQSSITHVFCYLDLDQFNVINDTFGHAVGDQLLKHLANHLLHKIRETDIIARLGGDEFGVLFIGCDTAQAANLANSLCELIRDYSFEWQGRTIQTSASAGLVPITAVSGSLTDIFSAADSACFVAKEQGRNRIHLFHPEDTALAQRHGQMQWMHRIKTALQENRFALYCEPFTPLNAQAEERSVYEILVRLIDEQGVAITPMEFIPAAERYHLMPAIDRWVIAATFSILASAAPQSSCVIYTINLSGQSLGDDNFLDFILFQFELTGVAPSNICFEITETAAIGNITRALRMINTLKSMGSRFALDDFGTGLSSFSYLKNIPVDALKIDGAFVRNMQHDKIDHALVETISRIGHIMGLTTIAEHVTDPDTLEKVRALGIDYAQGHAFAKTTPLEGVVRQHQMITPPAHD